ncbi:hypothetical protein Dimus_028090, partial [Dionaea muscipula]
MVVAERWKKVVGAGLGLGHGQRRQQRQDVRLAWGTATFGYNQPITIVGGGRMGFGGGVAGGSSGGVVAGGGAVAFEELVDGGS